MVPLMRMSMLSLQLSIKRKVGCIFYFILLYYIYFLGCIFYQWLLLFMLAVTVLRKNNLLPKKTTQVDRLLYTMHIILLNNSCHMYSVCSSNQPHQWKRVQCTVTLISPYHHCIQSCLLHTALSLKLLQLLSDLQDMKVLACGQFSCLTVIVN